MKINLLNLPRIVFLFASFLGNSQTITNQRTIISKNDNLFGCNYAQLSNGIYYMEGSNTEAFGDKTLVGFGERDTWITRFDENLQIQQEFLLGGENNDVPTNIAEFSNGDLLIAIQSSSDSSEIGTIRTRKLPDENSYDDIIYRINQQGDVVWERRIGGIYSDRIYSIKIFNDTVYMAGSTFSDASPNKQCSTYGESDFWFVSLSPEGEVLIDRNYGGTDTDSAYDLMVKEDYVYLIGASRSQISGNKTSNTFTSLSDAWLIKLNKQGDILSQRNINGDQTEGQATLVSTFGNQFVACISSNSTISGDKTVSNKGGYDVWLIEFDLDLNILSQRTIGTQGEDGLYSVTNSHGQLFLSMSSDSGVNGDKSIVPRGGHDFWMVVMDEDLSVLSQIGYGGSNDDRLFNTFITQPGELFLCGTSDSPISGDKTVTNNLNYNNAWVIKVSAPLELEKQQMNFDNKIYPIPSSDQIKVESNIFNVGSRYIILDYSGKTVGAGIFTTEPPNEINISNLDKGVYLLNIENHLFKFIKE